MKLKFLKASAKRISIIILCLSLFSALTDTAMASAKKIEDLVQTLLPAEKVSVYARYMDCEKPIVDINGSELMPPASGAKIVTAAAALKELGIDYRFKTEFLSSKRPFGTSIETLYIRGNGDPFVTPGVVWKMAAAVLEHGINRIKGNIIIDDSFFIGQDYPGLQNNTYFAYESPTGAVATNFNVIEFVVTPGHKAGSLAHVTTRPNSPYIKVQNKVKTGSNTRISALRKVGNDYEQFTVIGEMKLGSRPTTIGRSIKHPVKYAGSLFTEGLKQHGIKFDGVVKKGNVPPNAYTLFEVPSQPLSILVREMNKFSSNFIAEQITKHLGIVRSGRAGSTPLGLIATREWLDSIGISKDDYVLENGSGLSEKTRFSAKQLVKVLNAAGTDPEIAPDFTSSLSILGVDGTMRDWQSSPSLRGILRAKTGTLKGISTLTGYIPDKNGKLIAFSIMAQGLKVSVYEARAAEVKIAKTIAESH